MRDCHSLVDSYNFTNRANSLTSKVEIYTCTRPKLCHFGHYVVRVKLFSLKSFVPVWSVHMRNFHPGYRDLGRKNRVLGNRASPASHMNTLTFLQRKECPGKISETEPARSTRFIWRGPSHFFTVYSGNQSFCQCISLPTSSSPTYKLIRQHQMSVCQRR